MSNNELRIARWNLDRSVRRTKNTLFTLLIFVFLGVVVLVTWPH